MLCQKCQDLLDSSAEVSDPETFPHQTCIEGLKASVKARCIICTTIWFQYTQDEQQKLDRLEGYEFETYGLTSSFARTLGNSDFYLEFEMGPEAAEAINIPPRFIGFNVRKETDEEIDLGYDRLRLDFLQFSDSTDSSDVFSSAKKWLSQCLGKHASCNESTDTKWYPTRLLNFKSSDGAKDPAICLIETKAVTPSGPYMTLSHSWGKGHIITLNKQTYQTLLRGIPLSSLPPTFRDACIITRQIGVNYIWIDALCIFQDKDDLSDWSKEASLMHRVYSFSHCNIVAAENEDSSEPIFRNRNPESLTPPTTEILVRKRPSCSRFKEGPQSDKYVLDYSEHWRTVDDAHINTRGWVMQERLLSPRALHFGADQVYWECRESTASETNPDGFKIRSHRNSYKVLMKAPLGHSSWSSLVSAYSKCALTFPNDKLIAFSAVARLYEFYMSDDYVAGMWRRHLQGDLLWLTYSDERGVPTRYEAYIAPTWSWASIKGNVLSMSYESYSIEYLYEVDDYKLEYATEDKMGAIRSGWIRLSGQLRRLELWCKVTQGKKSWSLCIDNIEHHPNPYVDGKPWSSMWLDELQTDFDEESKSGTLYCMLARHYWVDDFGDASNMWDFLLFKLVDPSQGIFRRIGVARTRTGNVKNPYPTSSFSRGASSESAQRDGSGTTELPCAAYEGGVHSIYVI